jgi:hypothetical protein
MVHREQMPGSGVTDINLHHLPAGMYVVEITSESGTRTKRVALY